MHKHKSLFLYIGSLVLLFFVFFACLKIGWLCPSASSTSSGLVLHEAIETIQSSRKRLEIDDNALQKSRETIQQLKGEISELKQQIARADASIARQAREVIAILSRQNIRIAQHNRNKIKDDTNPKE